MLTRPKVIAVIPARGGSKEIPNKNIALLGNRPLLAWSIGSARQTQADLRLIVSTDDPAIAAIARELGAEAPFLRPTELAGDNVPMLDVVLHAVRLLREQGDDTNLVCALQPTSPLRVAKDIDDAVELLSRLNADSVVSVCRAHAHPQWMKSIGQDGFIKHLGTNDDSQRRQDLPPAYALNGAVFMARTEWLLESRTWYSDRTAALVMPPERSFDIDTPFDLALVNAYVSSLSVGTHQSA